MHLVQELYVGTVRRCARSLRLSQSLASEYLNPSNAGG